MKKRFYFVIGIVLLLALLPGFLAAPAEAAPQAARQSFLTVGDWNLDDGLDGAILTLAAYEVNWQVTKAAELQFGYEYCVAGDCWDTVDLSLKLSPKTYPYPQDLDLEAKASVYLTASSSCTLTQFVRILDSAGVVKKEATNGPYEYCISLPPYP